MDGWSQENDFSTVDRAMTTYYGGRIVHGGNTVPAHIFRLGLQSIVNMVPCCLPSYPLMLQL